jgi:4,5-DOPA dioxygenase extradiol
MNRLPAIFFGHGNPMNALLSNEYTLAWKQIGERIERPRSLSHRKWK